MRMFLFVLLALGLISVGGLDANQKQKAKIGTTVNTIEEWEDTFNGTDWYWGLLLSGQVDLPAPPGPNCFYEITIQMTLPNPPSPSFGYSPIWVKPWTAGTLYWNTWICAISMGGLIDWPSGLYGFTATATCKDATGAVVATYVSTTINIVVP